MKASERDNGANDKRIIPRRWHWARQEDQLLMDLVRTRAPQNWKFIARYIQGRSAKSCRYRWVTHLNPEVDKSPLSEYELKKLLTLHRIYGNKWSKITEFFPGRTDNQLKNKYTTLVQYRRKRGRESSNATGSQISSFSCMIDKTDGIKNPSFGHGSFSINGRNEKFLAGRSDNSPSIESVNLASTSVNQLPVHADSMASDARSAAPFGIQPLVLPGQDNKFVDRKGCKFIDFFGGWKLRIKGGFSFLNCVSIKAWLHCFA